MNRISLPATGILMAALFLLTGAAAVLQLLLASPAGIPTSFYFFLATALLSGAGALIIALTAKNEVVVYREKREEQLQTTDQARHDHHASLNLKTITEALKHTKTPEEAIEKFLQQVAHQLQAGAGAFYRVELIDNQRTAVLQAGYAIPVSEKNKTAYPAGDGLIGQLIVTGKSLYLDEIPEGYIKIISGLGSASPRYVFITPVLQNNEVTGVLELASFTPLSVEQRQQVDEACKTLAEKIGVKPE
jgi:methyl-accepting chemotaxis protein